MDNQTLFRPLLASVASTVLCLVVAVPPAAAQSSPPASAEAPPVTAPAPTATTTAPAAPATAPAAAPTTPPAAAGDGSKSVHDEMTCRMMKVTGSRVRKEKVCSTRGTTRNSKEWLRNQQDRGANEGSTAVVNGG